jgi:D-alanyl-D-alanine carboxypeptidase (penicillin-binding protein 5/6)
MKPLFKKKNHFLYFCLISFLFIASVALALTKENEDKEEERMAITKSFTPIPVLSDEAGFPILSARAALAVDLNSGINLYEKDPVRPLLPASTTKIVTALVAMDYYDPHMPLMVGKVSVEGQKMGLETGEVITVEDLLYGLLVYSANDAAEVLATNFPGGRDTFIAAMNLKAKQLHLDDTYFSNPSGLDGNGHVSTARDLIRVAEVAMRNENFKKIVGTKEKEVSSLDGKIKHRLVNINELLGKVDGVLGVKTGWTENARENLVTYLERDGKRIMIALLASQDRFGETEELINWIFNNYHWQPVQFISD